MGATPSHGPITRPEGRPCHPSHPILRELRRGAREVPRAVAASGAQLLESHENPNRGPDGRLFTDVARIGPADARKLLVLVSSTHGIEGYCGSGCQVSWLARRHYYRDATPDTAAILIHAINPFGFAWGRRVTEENVDLNRNFVDFSKPLPANPDYEALAEHINPREWSEAALAAANQAIARYYNLPNADFLPRAIHGGQFVNDKGTYFGGFAPTWARRTFEAIATKHFAHATDVCLIDYHTGLGPLGHGDLIYGIRPGKAGRATGSTTSRRRRRTSRRQAPRRRPCRECDPRPAVAQAGGAPAHRRVTAGGIEYGTHDVNSVLKAIRADNWLWCHGERDSAQGREIRAFLREMFYPAIFEWKIMVSSRSNDVIRMAWTGSRGARYRFCFIAAVRALWQRSGKT
jgi:hypothetical protein